MEKGKEYEKRGRGKKKKGNMGSKEGSPTYLITKAPSATGTRTSPRNLGQMRRQVP